LTFFYKSDEIFIASNGKLPVRPRPMPVAYSSMTSVYYCVYHTRNKEAKHKIDKQKDKKKRRKKHFQLLAATQRQMHESPPSSQ